MLRACGASRGVLKRLPAGWKDDRPETPTTQEQPDKTEQRANSEGENERNATRVFARSGPPCGAAQSSYNGSRGGKMPSPAHLRLGSFLLKPAWTLTQRVPSLRMPMHARERGSTTAGSVKDACLMQHS
jgi:hypothetical protein